MILTGFSTLPQSTIVVASTDASNGWSPVDAHDLSFDVRSSIRRFLSEMVWIRNVLFSPGYL